jgi:nucleoside-diphosphate-sugar epimerase
MAADRQTLVVTGASGVIGRALLAELDGQRVIGLVHRGEAPPGAAEVLRSDVAEPRLGLEPAEYARLAREADVVIHSAALTDWAADPELIRRINIGGTENVMQFARDAGAPVYHLSTSFIRAVADDAPVRLEDSNVIVNYCRSKIEGEAAVRAGGVPHTIFRPTNLIGDSRTGEIATTQAVQLVSEFICRGKAPLVPARPGTMVDVVPQDLVAKAIAAAVEREDLGQEWWITCGAGSMTIEDAIDVCVAFMERTEQPIERPVVLDPATLANGGGAAVDALSPMARMFFGRMLDFNEGLAACGQFPSSLDEVGPRYDLPQIDWRDAYERGLEFWARQKEIEYRPAAHEAGLPHR